MTNKKNALPIDDFDRMEWSGTEGDDESYSADDSEGEDVDLDDEEPVAVEAPKAKPKGRAAAKPLVELGRLPEQEINIEAGKESWDIKIPVEYEVWADGVYKRDLKSFTPGDPWPSASPDEQCPRNHLVRLTMVTRYPILVTREGRATTTFTSQEPGSGDLLVGLEVRSAGGFRRRTWVPIRTLVNAQAITALAEDGADITSVNAKDVVQYIAACRTVNGSTEPVRVLRRCGYYEIDGQPCWLVGKKWIGGGERLALDLANQSKLQRGYGPSLKNNEGLSDSEAYNAWRDFVWPYFTHERGSICRFLMGFTCVAPISELIGQYGFITHLYAQAGRGKSALALLVTTMWGNPEKGYLFQVLDKTRLGITAKFEHHASHLFMTYDEAQVAGDLKWDQLIYSLSSGQGRGRVSNTGADMNSDETSFRAIVLMTGEHTIVGQTKRDSGGQAKRVVEIDLNRHLALPLKDLTSIYDFLPRNLYGWGGVVFLQAVHQRFCRDAKGVAEFKTEYRKMKALIVDALPDIDGDLQQRLASIAFGEMLMLGLLFGDRLADLPAANGQTGWNAARAVAIKDALEVYAKGIAGGRADDSRPLHERCLSAIRMDMAANREAYPNIDANRDAADDVKQRGVREFSGFIIDGPNNEPELVILQGAFDRITKRDLDTPSRRVLADLVDNQIALSQGASHKVERSRLGVLPRNRYITIPYRLISSEDADARGTSVDFSKGWSIGDAMTAGEPAVGN